MVPICIWKLYRYMYTYIYIYAYVCSMCMCKCIQYVYVCLYADVYVSLPHCGSGGWGSNAYLPIISCSFYYSSCKSPNHSWIVLGDKTHQNSLPLDNLRQNSLPLMYFDVVFIQQIAHCHRYCQNPHEDLGIIIPLESR